MLVLKNGCWISQPTFMPKNWESSRASMSEAWYFEYNFHDPNFKEKYKRGKRIRIKSGINRIKNREQRQDAMRFLYENELNLLQVQHFNPITKKFSPDDTIVETQIQDIKQKELSEESPIRETFLFALRKKWNCYADKDVQIDVFSYVKRLYKSAVRLGLELKRTDDFKRKDLLNILDGTPLTDSSFNHCLGYIKSIFNELVLYELMEYNPADLIPRRKTGKQKDHNEARDGITQTEREKIANHLVKVDYRFFLFVNIFFYSGGRSI